MKFYFKMMSWLVFCLAATAAFAQTTSAISGTVTDKEGEVLPGAVINAVHTPTGTPYSTVSRADGRYDLRNLRVGGPYTLTCTMTGFKTVREENVFLKLGENKRVDFTMTLDSVEEELVVVASTNPIINPNRTGAFSNVTTESLEKLPTINRSLQDFARTNAYFVPNREQGNISVGGRNNRYNSIQIDGAQNTDLFGLADSNTPGGQTESQPISIDAIAELELIVSPYDVRYNGFTGGGINAVTRNGTNKMDGSIYYYYRDKDLVGDGPNDLPFGEFENTQLGARIGGPIIKDKLFYFVNVEQNRQDQPAEWLISQQQTLNSREWGRQAEADRFLQIMRDVYGYDPGGYGEFVRKTDSDNFFIRFDYNINETHRLTARHNFVDSENHSRERSNSTFEFPDAFYLITDETNSTVFQLNSTYANFVNEARLTYTTIKDRRGANNSELFPAVDVWLDEGTLRAGVERFSHANSLDQDILEFNEEITFFRGAHTITAGINIQDIKFDNLFIQDNLGTYVFDGLDAFEAGQPVFYDYSYSLTNDPQESANVRVRQYGLYVGDEWQLNENFNLILGLRGDVPQFSDDPTRNPVTEEAFGRATNVSPDGNWLWSPRVGFNWDIDGSGKKQLRGGIGAFSGRPIYVWLSNNYSNTGNEFARIDASFFGFDWNGERFFTGNDPINPPSDLPPVGATSTEFNLVDPDFKYPQVMRASLGYDQELPWQGLIATAEGVYTDVMEEVVYRNLNLEPGGTAYDGRTVMQRVDSSLGNAYYLTNTDKGYSWNTTFKLERPSKDGLSWSVSYSTGESKTYLDATSSRAVSNYVNLETPGDSNSNAMGRSDFDIKHRYVANLTYTAEWMANSPTTFAMFYNLRSGRPFSHTYARTDINGDGSQYNDLIYVPVDENDISLASGTSWEELNAYIEADPGLRNFRGQIVPRNASREPWNSLIDIRIAQDVAISSSKLQISLDIQNFGNLLDKNSGVYHGVNFSNHSILRQVGFDNDNNRPVFSFTPVRDEDGNASATEVRDTYSRWYAKLGVRWSF